jgi:hypothetical protein
MTSNTEEQGTTEAAAAAKETEGPKKAHVAPRKPHVAASKGKSGKKASPTKKGVKAPKKATKTKAAGPRQGSKTEKVLDLLKRSGGASLKDIMKATDWQAHSVRGFLSGTLGKKMNLEVKSTKGEDGERIYSLAK